VGRNYVDAETRKLVRSAVVIDRDHDSARAEVKPVRDPDLVANDRRESIRIATWIKTPCTASRRSTPTSS